MLSQTPLTAWHRSHKARLVPFAGYEMPVQYTSILDEARAVRASGGLFDVSHMAQLSVRGAKGGEALEKLITNDPARMAVGQAQYNFLCNENGGVLDDLVVYRRAEDWWYVCANASNRTKVADWLRSHLSKDVSFEDESDATGLIAVQGPRAEELLAGGASDAAALKALGFYRAAELSLWGVPGLVSRTGYTGEDGFEIYADPEGTAKLWGILAEKGAALGVIPTGLGARDTLRVEMGYPLYGQEIDEVTTPLEVKYRWAVKLDRAAAFVGQAALKRQAADGVPRTLVGLALEGRRIPRTGASVVNGDGKVVGKITSGTWSPHREAPVALALVETPAAGGILAALFGDTPHAARTTPLPFVPSHTKKSSKL